MIGTSAVQLTWPGRGPVAAPPGALAAVREGDPAAVLVEGDNVRALSALAAREGPSFALAYLDPPFLTGRTHERVVRTRGADGAVARALEPGFDDRWDSLDHYLGALEQRLSGAWDLLLPHGCLVLHVDPRTSHYARVLGDQLFGPRCFSSEIVWRYRRWPSRTPNFQRVHDVLLRWVKDPDGAPRFNQLYEPLAASTLATWGDRQQRAEVDGDGRRKRSTRTERPSPGVPLGDVWEIGIVAPVARERTGWPTQKPEALLERLVLACTHPGDRILDPYLGSGTTLAVAARHGRRALGIDRSADALGLVERRLVALGVGPARFRVEAPLPVHEDAAPVSGSVAARPGVRRAAPRSRPAPPAERAPAAPAAAGAVRRTAGRRVRAS